MPLSRQIANRQSRQRHEDLAVVVENRKPVPQATEKFLGTVFNGGAMPSGPDKFYLVHPTELNCSEVEGDGCAPVVDTTKQVAVDFLGNTPSVGEMYPVFAVGGRWVAERGKGQATINCCVTICGSCKIPSKDLQLTWTDFSGNTGIVTLPFLDNHTSAPFDPTPLSPDGLWIAQLVCNTNTIGINLYFGSVSSGFSCTYPFSGPSGSYKLISFTCNPLGLSVQNIFEFGAYTCGGGSSGEPAFGNHTIMTMVVTDPSPVMTPPGLMCQTFVVRGCGGKAYPGVTVSVSGGASGVTGVGGTVFLSWQGSPGNYTVSLEGVSSRFDAFPATVFDLGCSGATTIGLVAAPGYTCTSVCVLPVSNTLEATWDTVACGVVNTTFVWTPAISAWIQPAGAVCGPTFEISQALQLTGPITASPMDCPPSLELVYTFPNGTLTVTE